MKTKQSNFEIKWGKRKAEWINNIRNIVHRLEKGPEADVQFDSLAATLKEVSNFKIPGHNSMY